MRYAGKIRMGLPAICFIGPAVRRKVMAMRTMNRLFWCWGLLLALGAGTSCPAAVLQPDIASIRGDQSRLLFGEGAGVVVGIVDGGVNAAHPALAGSMIAAKDFSHSGTTNDDPTGDGHGTGIMSLLIGHDNANGFLGLAPAAKFVNARVVNAANNTTDPTIANGVFWAAGKGAKVINISLGEADANPNQNKLNLMLDYAAEKYKTVFVVAAGNENASAVGGAPSGQFNGFTVGATFGSSFDKVTEFSNYSLATDLRSKPDVVAPGQGVTLAVANYASDASPYTNIGEGTSFSAPMVGGLLAQMIGYGKAHHLSVDPLALKAVLMTSSTHIYEFEGGTWTARHQLATASGVTVDQSLDAEQGAGRIDGVEAYDIYARKTDVSTLVANWAISSMKANGSFSMKLGNLKAGQHVDSTLTWLRHVGRSGSGSLSASNKFFQSATLADFSLTLLLNGKKIETIDSNWDNLDYLSLDIPQNGNYSLLVSRSAGSGLSVEEFGLAARVLANANLSQAQANVARAQTAFASTGAQRSFDPVVNTPEPSGVAVFALALVLIGRRRDR